MKSKAAIFVLVTIIGGTGTVAASEIPLKDAMPLSEIVKNIEDKGYTPITEISFDEGAWEAEAYKAGYERELKIDPVSGEILSDQPD